MTARSNYMASLSRPRHTVTSNVIFDYLSKFTSLFLPSLDKNGFVYMKVQFVNNPREHIHWLDLLFSPDMAIHAILHQRSLILLYLAIEVNEFSRLVYSAITLELFTSVRPIVIISAAKRQCLCCVSMNYLLNYREYTLCSKCMIIQTICCKVYSLNKTNIFRNY